MERLRHVITKEHSFRCSWPHEELKFLRLHRGHYRRVNLISLMSILPSLKKSGWNCISLQYVSHHIVLSGLLLRSLRNGGDVSLWLVALNTSNMVPQEGPDLKCRLAQMLPELLSSLSNLLLFYCWGYVIPVVLTFAQSIQWELNLLSLAKWTITRPVCSWSSLWMTSNNAQQCCDSNTSDSNTKLSDLISKYFPLG